MRKKHVHVQYKHIFFWVFSMCIWLNSWMWNMNPWKLAHSSFHVTNAAFLSIYSAPTKCWTELGYIYKLKILKQRKFFKAEFTLRTVYKETINLLRFLADIWQFSLKLWNEESLWNDDCYCYSWWNITPYLQ